MDYLQSSKIVSPWTCESQAGMDIAIPWAVRASFGGLINSAANVKKEYSIIHKVLLDADHFCGRLI